MSKSKPKQSAAAAKAVAPYNIWKDDGVEYPHAEFMKRLKEVHGIDPKTTKGTKKMLMHMDGDTWFAWDYEWEIGGKKFTQHTRTNRTGENLHIWSNQGE